MRRLALALLLAVALPAHAQMYKCVDARGVTHYTDKPLPGCKGGAVNIHGQYVTRLRMSSRSPG